MLRQYLKVTELIASTRGFINAINLLWQILIRDYSTFLVNKYKSEVAYRSRRSLKGPLENAYNERGKTEQAVINQYVSNQSIPQVNPATSFCEMISYCFWLNHRYLKWRNLLIDADEIHRYFDIGELHRTRNEMITR